MSKKLSGLKHIVIFNKVRTNIQANNQFVKRKFFSLRERYLHAH